MKTEEELETVELVGRLTGVELDVRTWCQVLGVDSVEELWIQWVELSPDASIGPSFEEGEGEDRGSGAISWFIPIGGVLRACQDVERLIGLSGFCVRWKWILEVLESRVVDGSLVEVVGGGSSDGLVADWPDWLVDLCCRQGSPRLSGSAEAVVLKVSWVLLTASEDVVYSEE